MQSAARQSNVLQCHCQPPYHVISQNYHLLQIERLPTQMCQTELPSIEDIFDDCDDQLFSRINTNSLHILQQYLSDRPSLNYSLRPRRHSITPITKTSELNHRDFIIRNIYKDLY